MQALTILLLTIPNAANGESLTLPIPHIDTVWDSRGTEQTDGNDKFDHDASLTVRITSLPTIEGTSIEAYLNGSSHPEKFTVLSVEENQAEIRLQRRLLRGDYCLEVALVYKGKKSLRSKVYRFQVASPPPPTILAVHESDVAIPFEEPTDTILLKEGKDVKIAMGGLKANDEVRFALSGLGFPAPLTKVVVPDQPIQKPILVDFTQIKGLKPGDRYRVQAQIIRKGDASEVTSFEVQIGLKPPPMPEPKQ